MQELKTNILPYSEEFREQILSVWERSVLATHHFLSSEDFESIKQIVHTISFSGFEVYCLTRGNKVIGFLGVAEKKIEMLFLDPAFFGQGMGKKLTDFALRELGVDKVDVNEQNSGAVKFYEKMGFLSYERTEKDDQGKDYPLLRMKLAPQNI